MQAALTRRPSAAIALADGTVYHGRGYGACGVRDGELVFNTAMTGYQEIMSDPSYAGQIITFTFPHVGNVGTNGLDVEAKVPVARGIVTRTVPTLPSSWRNRDDFSGWLRDNDIVAIGGIDTRQLASLLRDRGAQNAALAHDPRGDIDVDALVDRARSFPGIVGADLVPGVTCARAFDWTEAGWNGHQDYASGSGDGPHVVVVDYGVKRNILRSLSRMGFRITVVPAGTAADDILAKAPDGVLLSNGPGDPAATGRYAVSEIAKLVASGKPVFGICLGHQMLGIALGARTTKMAFGHHGANHPVKDLVTGKVEITSQNHGFAIADEALPENVEVTHRSLFDGTIQGIRLRDRPVFSVQYHPEASPGPTDSHYLFDRFLQIVRRG
ncbi:MAG: glutamine-hydrolyzing carbamoyl-phosphate synthase small subunit [Geminicoccaceae bacterium]